MENGVLFGYIDTRRINPILVQKNTDYQNVTRKIKSKSR